MHFLAEVYHKIVNVHWKFPRNKKQLHITTEADTGTNIDAL